jgi:hypothetical protein
MAGRRRRGEDGGGVSPRDYEGGSPFLDEWEQSQERLAIANPFLGASAGFGPLSERGQAATKAFEEQSARLPNVLVRPPSDFGAMTTERQLAWQQNLKAQQELETGLLQSESARRQGEEADIRRKEGLELIKRSAELNPKDDDYHVRKNALIRQFPGGVTSPEAQAILTGLDERRKVVENASEEEKKAIATTERARGEGNFQTARTEASALGPEFLGNFLEISKSQGPDAAIAYVTREGAKSKEAGLRTQLQTQGMTPEEVTATYGGEQIPFRTTPFQFPAAEARAKGGATERRQAQLAYSNLMAAKAKAKHPLTGEIQPEQWGDAEEARLAAAAAELDSLTGRPIGQTATTATTPAAAPAAKPAATPQAAPKVPEAPIYTKRKRNPTTGKTVGLNAKTNTWEVIP